MRNTIFDVSQQIKAKLSNLYPSSEVESFIFMVYKHILAISSAQTLAYPEKEVGSKDLNAIMQVIQRLEKMEPIQYILGNAEFYDCVLSVKPGVLIPRPETEELVHWILNDNGEDSHRVIDIGTGSGAIPIALSSNRKQWDVHGIDVSETALNISRENVTMNQVKVQLHQLDVLREQLPGNNYDMVISNPPYVTHKEKQLMQDNVLQYEPHLALFVEDDDPLLFYRRIGELALDQLNPGGQLFYEINEQFGKETSELLENMGFEDVVLRKDLSGKDRMIKAIKPY